MLRGHLATIPATLLAIGTIRVYGTGFFLYGLTTMLQDPERWSGPSYQTATAMAPPWVWGLVIAALGLLSLVGSLLGSFLIRNLGLYGTVVWLGTFTVAILEVARRDVHVSYGGPVLYAIVIAAMCFAARAREVPRAHKASTA